MAKNNKNPNQHEISYWEKDLFTPKYDLIIIGAGFTGIHSAIQWKKRYPSQKVLLLNRNGLPTGASTKNAGFLCIGSPSELLADIAEKGEHKVIETLTDRWKGMQYLLHMIEPKLFDLDRAGGHEVFFSNNQEPLEFCRNNLHYLNEILFEVSGIKDYFFEQQPGWKSSTQIESLISNRVECLVHPGKLVHRLLDIVTDLGIEKAFNQMVTSFKTNQEEVKVFIKNGQQLTTKRLVLATNGFSKKLAGQVEIQPARNAIFLSEPVKTPLPFHGAYHQDRGYVYFRKVSENRLLIGGGRNQFIKEEQTDEFGINPKIKEYLTNLAVEHLGISDFIVGQQWSGILGITPTKSYLVEKIAPNVYLAGGLNGMGVAISSQIPFKLIQVMEET